MNGRTLRTTAGLAGTVAAAAAGALTVGLIAGVVHPSTQTQATSGGTSATSTNSTSTQNNSTSGIGSVSQNAQSVAASHGS